MGEKWFSIGFIGLCLAIAILVVGFQFANAPIGVACANNPTMEWRNGNCIAKEVK